MKRGGTLNGIMDEIQRENNRLKTQIVSLRKQLNSYENKMIDQLSKFDQNKLIFDSPMQCLEAFLTQITFIFDDYKQKNTVNHQLQSIVKSYKQKYQLCQQRLQRIQKNLEDQKAFYRDLQQKKKKSDDIFQQQIRQLKKARTNLENTIGQLQLKLQLKQISIGQQKRLAVSAISHQSKRQMLQLKQNLQAQYLKESVKMREEMKEKDQKIKNLIKGLLKYDKGEKISVQEIMQMRQLVQYVGNIQGLNQIVTQLKDQIFQLKNNIKDNVNKRSAAQLKNQELKNQIKNLLLKQEKLLYQNTSLQELVIKTREQLKNQKNSSKKLQYYFEQKWNNQFQKVKNHLQKVYNDKVTQHKEEIQQKKNEISHKIDSYVFIHNQDQKIVKDLKKTIETLYKQIHSRINQIKNQKTQIEQYKIQLLQINKMHNEDRQAAFYQFKIKLQDKQDELNQLKQQLNKTSSNQQVFQLKSLQVTNLLKQNFKQQKRQLQSKHRKQKQQIIQQKTALMKQQRNRYQQMIAMMRRQQQRLKTHYEFQIVQAKLKYTNQLQHRNKEMDQERIHHRQEINQIQLRQKSLKKEIQDLKQYYMKKIKDLQKQLQNKTLTIQVINVKSQNDQDLKKELRMMIEQKIYQSKQLNKDKQDLRNQIQAKDSQINHLNHQITGLRLTKDDWLQIIIEVRDDFFHDMAQAIQNHKRQIQIFKSKIWELESIISKRPIRIKDEKKIRSLSQQKKQLQTKIQIKQAQNIVLKQIKQYYQKKNEIKTCTAQMSMTSAQFKKPQNMLIMNKRPRRTKINFYQSSKHDDQGQSNTDIVKMRKYLQRCREVSGSVHQESQLKNVNKGKSTSRNYLNRSLDQ